MDRAALLALVDEAARDPSSSRRLLEYLARLLAQAMRDGQFSTPSGYIYAPAHTWIVGVDNLLPEPIPVAEGVEVMRPLDGTANQPVFLKVPFDALIWGVAGWASAEMPVQLTNDEKTAVLLSGTEPDGRDWFSCDWTMDGDEWFTTDGRSQKMTPANVCLGTRTRPRPLAWLVRRNRRIGVRFRNLSNLVVQRDLTAQEENGFPISAQVAWYALNMERP